MEFPNKIHTESKGEIFEHDFIKTVYDDVIDVLEIYYTDDKVVHIAYNGNSENTFQQYFPKCLYMRDCWLDKEDLIKSRIDECERVIEHNKKSFARTVERLNKLTK